MNDIKAKILSNKQVAPGYFKMALYAPEISASAKPGQFVQVRCSDTFDPLLRRPLGIYRLKGEASQREGIELLYEVVGKGTGALSKKKEGDFVDILGPLGNGWRMPSASKGEASAILIAGGIGVVPLVSLAEEIRDKNKHIKIIVLIGAKTKEAILCEKEFKELGAQVHTATDDGSCGCKGMVSKLLEKTLSASNAQGSTAIYACGPHAMLECIGNIAEKEGVRCQVSMEEKMACGLGVCLGCAVKVKGSSGQEKYSYKLACKDGPIFNTNEIIW